MALLATQQIDRDGLNATYVAAAAGGDTAAPDDRAFLHVKNGGASPVTVTLVTPGTVSGLAISDTTVSVAAGGAQFIPLYPSLYRDPSSGLVSITYSGVTSVTVAVIRA